MRLTACSVALTLAVVAGLSACDNPVTDSGPDPADAADLLATALATGDFGKVGFTGTTPQAVAKSYGEVVAGLGDLRPAVTVAEVADGDTDDAASASLTWTWDVAGQDWTYATAAPLTLVDDEWQATWDPNLVEPSLEAGSVLDRGTLLGRRGEILGAGEDPLVTERPVLRYGIDRPAVKGSRAGASARRLAKLVGIGVQSYVKRVEAAGPQAFVEAITYRRSDVPPIVTRDADDIPGVRGVGAYLPLAPSREFAAPILGSVGEATAEMIKKNPETYHLGDQAGLSGLQARYDDELRGAAGAVVNAVSSAGEENELFRVDPTDGEPLELTLDRDLQSQAEDLLSDVGPGSALVAIRPSTGDLVAAANGPGNGGLNLATYGQFAPGSTFKAVSALALLRAGLTPASVVPCTTRITVDGKAFTNYSDYPAGAIGDISLRSALANSCNTAFISQAGKLSGTDLYDAAASLGLGIDHDLGFPAYFGSVEPAKSETEAAADMIGQGTILASPLAMATVIASVQRGATVVPHLVAGFEDSAPEGAAPLAKGEARALHSMLRGVVTGGSGRGLADLPGPPAIAKTGTAEFGSGKDLRTHAWMIAAQGDLAVAVFVDVGDSGSGTAGPILEAFLRAAR